MCSSRQDTPFIMPGPVTVSVTHKHAAHRPQESVSDASHSWKGIRSSSDISNGHFWKPL